MHELHPQRTTQFCHEASQWAYDHYTNLGYNVLFATVHGSYLYGTTHENSDLDFYVVVQKGKNSQKVYDDNTDVLKVSLEKFLSLVNAGSHQAVEALYSPYKVMNPDNPYSYLINALRPSQSAFMRKSLSAASSFRHRLEETTDAKKAEKYARHARRLEQSAVDMMDMHYNPVYTHFSS